MRMIVRRHHAEILEDAIEVEVPEGVEDVETWAIDNYDELLAAATYAPHGDPFYASVIHEDRPTGVGVEVVDDEWEVEPS